MGFLRYATLFLISIFPLYILRFSFFGIPSTFLEAGFLVYTVLVMLYLLKKGFISEMLLHTPLTLAVIFFLFFSLLSVFFSSDIRGGVGAYRAYFLEPVLLFSMLVVLGRRTKIFVTDVLLGLAVSAFYLSILAILQYALQVDWFAPHEIAAGRVSGVFNSANALALYLEPIIFALAVVVLRDFKLSKRSVFFALTLVLSVIAIALSRSMGSLVAFLCLLGFILVRQFCLRYRLFSFIREINATLFLWFVLGIFLVTMMLVGLSYRVVGSMPLAVYTGPNTFLIRMIVWTGTSNLLSEHWITGAGLSGFKELYTSSYLPVQYTESLQYPHSIFLNFWTELGLGGLLAFIYVCYSGLHFADQKRSEVRIILYGILFLIFVHGLVDVPYFKNDLSMEFWTFMSLSFFSKGKS